MSPSTRIHDEQGLLELTQRIGIDWTVSLDELRQRHGVKRWYGFEDVIEVPTSELAPGLGGPWLVRWREEDGAWPPLSYRCEVSTDAGVQAQHRALEQTLCAVFGPGKASLPINVWGASWRFGVFDLRILTFKRELSPGENPLYERHPELWNKTEVRLKADHTALTADESLAAVAVVPVLMRLPRHGGSMDWRSSAPLVRRNPRVLLRTRRTRELDVRLQDGHLVLTGPEISVVLHLARCRSLQLVRAARARGQGFAYLQAELIDPGLPAARRWAVLASHRRTDGLDSAASQLAEAIKRPLGVVECWDD